ncbi:hypothetical protein LTR95_013546 [Oleoguttula sp. CCFEE 5521]
MRAVLSKGGDLTADFAEALMLHARDLNLDERIGEACKWHDHFDTPACGASSAIPESEPEPEEEKIAQTDGTADSRPASSQEPTQRLPARPIPAGMGDVFPQPALRGVFHRKVRPLYDPVPFNAGQNTSMLGQQSRTRTLGGQQDGSPSAEGSKDGLKQSESTSATPSRKPSKFDLKRTESNPAVSARKQSQVNLMQTELSSGTPTRKLSQADLNRTNSKSAIQTPKQSQVKLEKTEPSSDTPTRKHSQVDLKRTERPSAPPTRKPSQVNLTQAESSSGTPTRKPSEADLKRINSTSTATARKLSQPQAPPATSSSTPQPSEPVVGPLRRSFTIPRTNPLPSALVTTKLQPKTPPERSPTATPGPRRPSQTPFPSPHASDSPLVPATPVPRLRYNKDCVCTLLGYPPCVDHIAITRWCDCTDASHHTPAAVEAGKTDSCKSISDYGTERSKSSKGKEAVQWEGVDAALEETDGEECGGRGGVKGVVRKLGCAGDN